MDKQLLELVRKADSLASQARAAAQAGDHKRAAELRRQFDLIYNQLEAQAGGQPTRQPQPVELGR